MLVLTWLIGANFLQCACACAGWPSHKGHNGANPSWGNFSSVAAGRVVAKALHRGTDGGFLTLHLDRLLQSDRGSRERSSSRRNRRSSNYSSPSRRRSKVQEEMQELRAYRNHHEAMEMATADMEREEKAKKAREAEFAELEARILRAIPKPQPPATSSTGCSSQRPE